MRVLHGPRPRGIVAPIVPTVGSSWLALSPHSLGSVTALVPREDCHLWLTDLDRWDSSSDEHRECLDPLDWERARRKPEGISRERFIRSRMVLRRILASLLDQRPIELHFESDAHGKPALKPPYQHCHFNLSHSGALLLVGVSMSASIGVDIEVPRSVPRASQLAKRVFTADEQALLRQAEVVSESARDEVFLKIWTRKEAYLKCRGDGFTMPARDFAVGIKGSTKIADVDIRSLDLPSPGYAALASATPVSHTHRYHLCPDE